MQHGTVLGQIVKAWTIDSYSIPSILLAPRENKIFTCDFLGYRPYSDSLDMTLSH